MRNRLVLFFVLCLCSCKESLPIAESSTNQPSKAFIQSFHEGVRLKLQGNYNEAIDRFKTCLENQPSDDATHFALAQTYLLLGDLQQAEAHTFSAVQSDRNNLFYQVELAYMLREKGTFNEAAELFEVISKSRTRNTEYYMAAIDCYKRAGNYSKAIKVIESLERVRGNHLEAAIRKHRIYIEMGKVKEAEKVLLSFYTKSPKNTMVLASLVDFYFQNEEEVKGVQMLKELVLEDPQNGMGFLMLAEYEYQKGNRKKTGDYFYKAILSENITVKETVSAFDYLVYHKEEERIGVCLEVLQNSFSDNDTIMTVIGDYYFKKASLDSPNNDKKLLQKAIIKYNEAVKINPNRFDLWQKLLYLHYDAKQWELLESVAESTVRIFPLKPAPYYFGSVACNQLENYQRASELVDQGLVLIMEDLVLESDLMGQRGEALFGKRQLEKAVVCYLRAIELKQSTAPYLSFNLCMNMYQYGYKLEKALDILDQSQGLEMLQDAEDGSFYLLKFDLLFELERYDEALVFLNKIDSEEQNVLIEVLVRRGDVCAKLLQKEKSMRFWMDARTMGGNSKKLIEKIETGRYVE
jgi:tetratricopeptide (TPR) repeat protein